MKATIYHNPMCGTSRKTLDILREQGADPREVEAEVRATLEGEKADEVADFWRQEDQ